MLRLKNIRIRPKLIILFALTGLIPLCIGGYFSTRLATRALVEKSFEQLLTVQSVQKNCIKELFLRRFRDLDTLAKSERLAHLVEALDLYQRQSYHAPSGPFPVRTTEYKDVALQYIDIYRNYNELYDFRDLLLITPKTGKVMFSVLQENDLGTNLAYGRYRNSGLARIWRKVATSGQAEVVDYSPFVPSNGLECAFIGQPIIDAEGKMTCIVVLQLAPSFITKTLKSRNGLGETGESYLFNWEKESNTFELRSNMETMGGGRFVIGFSDLHAPKYWIAATQKGTAGGHGVFLDSDGNQVLVAYNKIPYQDLNWYLISKINQHEITAPVRTMIRQVGSIVIVLVLFIAACSLVIANNFTKPILGGVAFAKQISEGNLDQTLTLGKNQKDELGDLARALNDMARNLYELNWLQHGKMDLEDKMRDEQDTDELAKRFISFFSKHIHADLGALYFHSDGVLRLSATYAFTDRTGNFDVIRVGEGMVGQAALERKILIYSDVPEDTPVINYGAGECKPRYFLIAPLVYDGNLVGVFFLGSVKPFNDLQKLFIERNLENSAIHFNVAHSRQRIRELLEDAQEQQLKLSIANSELEEQAEALKQSQSELQAQQEELRVANEELQEQTKALKESEEELQSQQEELRVTNEELEGRTQALEEQRESMLRQNEALEKARADLEKQTHQLEVASKYKSEFLANMSHELRTPLNSILILSQLLAKNKDNKLSEKQVESANAIHSSGSDLLRLINEILDLSKVEAGRIELYFENASLSGLLDDLKRVFKDIADSKGIGFTIEIDEGLPQAIYTDSHRLQQILRNLLTNAFKFTHQGNVCLHIARPSVELASVKGLDPATSVAFAVIDEGIGIPKQKQEAIFEAFQQADGSTSRTYGGTGLGLSISREFVKLLGGSIHLKSEENKGSVFTIVIPEHAPEQNGQPAQEKQQCELDTPPELSPPPALENQNEEDPLLQEERTAEKTEQEIPHAADPVNDDRKTLKSEDKSLLIIEDDVHFSKVVRDFAKERGFKCLVAEDGETGLHFADYYKPSAILLDIGLPGIDGWTVMERLKENPQLRHIPVHFISANDNSLDALRMGAVGFLTKPVSMEAIENALAKIENLITKPVRKLLVVEDDPVQRESIKQLIGNGDVETTTVSTGHEAFEILSSETYDCMILDLGLSDMSGFELLDKLKQSEICSRIPVIIYTGRELSRDEEKELRKYADSIIIKGAKSPERLLDETALFLHRVEKDLPQDKQQMLKMIHNKESVLGGKTILLVDDDMRNVFALSNVLEDKGMEVIIARNGQECLDKLHNNASVDLILMDIMMPQMDGYEAMREIRKEQRYKKLPIIALTAKAMKGDRNKCIEAGANDYLAKPVNTDKLISMLRVWLYS